MINPATRILWLSHFMMYPPHGGARIRSFNVLRELARGFAVDVFALDPRPDNFPGRHPDAERSALLAHASSLEVVPSATGLARKVGLFLQGVVRRTPVTCLKNDSRQMRMLVDQAAKTRLYRAVHVDTIELSTYLSSVRQLPIVLNHHNVESQLLARAAKHQTNPALRLFFRAQALRLKRLEDILVPRVRCNLTVSDADRVQLLRRSPGAMIEVVPNGVDTDFHAPESARRDRVPLTLIWAGGMDWFPNRDAIGYFLDTIWPLIASSHPTLRLLLVGRKPPPAVTLAYAADRIEAPGFVDDVRPYLARGDIYIVPIRVGGGTRLKILDAFASGIPLVSTSVGCEGLEVQDGVHLLIRDAPHTFAAAVLQLVADRSQRLLLADNARRLVDQFYSWKRIGDKLRAVYTEVTREPATTDSSGTNRRPLRTN